jgi:hypothetical protein
MKKLILAAILSSSALLATGPVMADDEHADRPLTLAVFGDWPYSQKLLDRADLLINSINSDRDVSLVMHLGDIHSGSMPCTGAAILPPLPTSNPGWNQAVFHAFQQFHAPVVYTPGDNEWSDCHKSKQFSSGAPLKELASVRSLFFSQPGRTLGGAPMAVASQGLLADAAHPTDAQFIENVMWEKSKVVFATFNIPGGSNDDASQWTGSFADPVAQVQEMVDREAANLRWLDATFALAHRSHARAVVIGVQADMWDPEAIAAGGAGLSNYTPFVRKLADLSQRFQRPVLLLNGDTHLALVDQPLALPSSATGLIHGTAAVPNLTRIVVQGSTNAPAEWLRLRIDPRDPKVFSWSNVSYCANPAGGC